MKCGITTIKLCLLNQLYRKHLINDWINDFRKNKLKYIFYNVLILIGAVSAVFVAMLYGLSITVIRYLFVVVVVILTIYLIIKLVHDMNKACVPICKAVGIKNFKRSIELIIKCGTDEKYEPVTERDIKIMDKLEQLAKEMP